ncbi:MAG: CDP-alcohol phosphatidyltransferase family protein [Pseudomonadota bacterium]
MTELMLLVAINGGFILGYIIFLLCGCNKKAHSDLKKKRKSGVILFSLENYWFTITEPFVKLFINLGITPNMITFIGLAISISSGVFFGLKLWGLAGWVMIAGGVFDLFDGRVARATRKVTISGAYLDSVTDRYSDGVILGGLLWAFKDHWMLFFVILSYIGFYAVSYTKARAEGFGIKCNVGMFQRPERIFSLGLSAIFSPILSYYMNVTEPLLIYIVVITLSIGTLVTSIYRLNYSFNKLKKL